MWRSGPRLGTSWVVTNAYEALIAKTCRDSLILVAGMYESVGDDVFVYRGERPAGHWHVHGFLEVRPRSLFGGVLRRVTVRKRRWCLADRSATRHSRPPDDLGLRFDGLVVAVTLFAVLDAAVGLHQVVWPYRTRRTDDAPSVRTVQRWLARAQRWAMPLHQALRFAAMERCEPRPETLFPTGLPPPVRRQQRRWRHPSSVNKLWQGLAMVLRAASSLDVPTATLLAEARGRWTPPTAQHDR